MAEARWVEVMLTVNGELAEAVAEAAMGVNGTAIHRMPARKR